ncbi:LuxR C-terminal-related transcriptional regulator [Chitinophagaceae bacterium MMS25-I14]
MSVSFAAATAVILDDHRFFADSMAVMLEHNSFVNAAYAFTDAREVRKYIIQQRENEILFFLDYNIPDVNILQLINDVRRLYTKITVVILSSVTNPSIIKKILTYNPEGFLTKTASLSELADCLAAIRSKTQYISPYIREILENATGQSIMDRFTPKEIEVLSRIAQGESINEMAAALNLSPNTIAVHRRNMLAKTGLKSVTALLALAVQAGIITQK